MREQDRWVVDTNVLVSRLLAPRGVAAQALDKALKTCVLLVSDATLDELSEVLARQRFEPYLSAQDRQRFFSLLAGVSSKLEINQRIQACRDPKDDKFLDVALSGQAKALITGDQDLLALHPFHGIPIWSPSQFLSL
jgi:uncharacterized protein